MTNARRPLFLEGFFGGLRAGGNPDRNIQPKKTVGVPGFAIYGGYLQREEKNAKLESTRERYRFFADFLANTLIVAAGVRYFLDLVGKAKWTVTPTDPDNTQAVEMAEFVEDVIHDMRTPWRRVVRRAAMFKFYGFSVQEWTAKMREDDNQIGFLDIEPRSQYTIERWDTERNGHVLGIVQCSPQDSSEIYIPRGKTVYIFDDSLSDSPEGLGLFRHMVQEVQRLERYQQLEGLGYDTDLRGIPVGYAPLTELEEKLENKQLSQAAVDSLILPLRTFMEHHVKGDANGVILDSEPYRDQGDDADVASGNGSQKFRVDLLDAGQMGHEAINVAIMRVTRLIATLLGVEELLLGAEGTGSFAMSSNKTKKLFMLIQSTMRELEDGFQKDIVDRLWLLNGFDNELKPELKAEDIQFNDVQEIAAILRDISTAGVPISRRDELVREFFEMLGLTPPDPDEMEFGFNSEDAALPLSVGEGNNEQQAQDAINDDPMNDGEVDNG